MLAMSDTNIEQLTKNIPIHCISVTALIIGTGTMFLNVISMQ